MEPLPSGTVTFVFTDLEGSTRLQLRESPDQRFPLPPNMADCGELVRKMTDESVALAAARYEEGASLAVVAREFGIHQRTLAKNPDAVRGGRLSHGPTTT